MRATWAAVTSATPSSSTVAVIDISAMPPGDTARMSVGRPSVLVCASSAASPTDRAIPANASITITKAKRGIVRSMSGL